MTHCNRIRHSRDQDGDAVSGARTFAMCRWHRRRLRPDTGGPTGVGRRDVVDLADSGGLWQALVDHPAPRSRPRSRIAARARTRARRGTGADEREGARAKPNPGAGNRSVLGPGRSNVRPMPLVPAGGISAAAAQGAAPPTGLEPVLELDTSPEAAASGRLGTRPVRSARSAVAALASLATHRSPLWRPRP